MRISEASGDTALATRALRLYVHTVGKAKLARKFTESDATWVFTLAWGARMLCRVALAADSTLGQRGIDEAREAGEILEKAKERLDPSDKTLKAYVELAEGIWNTVMAIKGIFANSISLFDIAHLGRRARSPESNITAHKCALSPGGLDTASTICFCSLSLCPRILQARPCARPWTSYRKCTHGCRA
jgi:hypothetical protein